MDVVVTAAKAIIIEDGMLLTIRKRDAKGHSRYFLPGGRQNYGESLTDTIRRECMEELGAQVEPERLALIWELRDGALQMNECVFLCHLESRPDSSRANGLDWGQDAWAWLYVDSLADQEISPPCLAECLNADGSVDGLCYLGVVSS